MCTFPIADALKAPSARVCLFAAISEIGATVRSRGTGMKDLELQLRSLKTDATFDLVCKLHKLAMHLFVAIRCPHKPCNMTILFSILSDVEYETAGYTTLMESLTHEQVTHKFKTLVRVVAAYPCRASELRLLLTGSFCLRLTLEDPTARIHAYVHKDDGVMCF
nr:unnamed protein product [Digitaria exilis]